MIPRYEDPVIARLFADEARFARWIAVELAVTDALGALGEIPAADAARLRQLAPTPDAAFAEAVNERERITHHDTAAFVDVLQARIGDPCARWIHFGLTSSDVVDTALSLALVRGLDRVLELVDGLADTLRVRALETRDLVCLGRTHGMAAEPTTFGAKLALFWLALQRARARLVGARETIGVGKLSGAVGTYSALSPEVERRALEGLGLRPTPATQVIPRDRHADVVWSLASLGAVLETIALEVRHLARSEVGEVAEPFAAGQKGSSAMPHKRNPVLAERLAGMARLARAAVVPALEDVALWHERDISHSSVERVMLPDAFHVASYGVALATRIVAGLTVHPEAMAANLAATRGLVYSQQVLLALVRRGMARDDAYRIVQAAAARTLDEGVPFLDALADDASVPLTPSELAELASTEHLVANLTPLFERLEESS